jgi:hypothetical protein
MKDQQEGIAGLKLEFQRQETIQIEEMPIIQSSIQGHKKS